MFLGGIPPVGNFAEIYARGRGGLQKHTWRNLTTPSPERRGGPGGRRGACGRRGRAGARGRARGAAGRAGGVGRAGAHGRRGARRAA